jgi:hypothetical protein
MGLESFIFNEPLSHAHSLMKPKASYFFKKTKIRTQNKYSFLYLSVKIKTTSLNLNY